MNLIKRTIASIKMRGLKKVFASENYLEAYARSTDLKASIDPAMAIGGLWDEMGRHQFEFMRQYGLRADHRFLDIGCGSLRGGLFFIDFLNENCYTGFDISPKVVEIGSQKVLEKGLTSKSPKLLVNRERNLKFDLLDGEKFDFILAQSVFSHLKPEHIRECFEHLGKVMRAESRFFFTHHPGEQYRQRSEINFEYPVSFFQELAEKNGYLLTNLSNEYRHPRGQNMLMATPEVQ